MPSVQRDHPDAWRVYRRRTYLALASPIVALPGGVFVGLALTQRYGADVPVAVGVFLLATIFLPCSLWLLCWRCPRCGNRFCQLSETAYNPFVRKCCTCGLRLRAPRRSGVAVPPG